MRIIAVDPGVTSGVASAGFIDEPPEFSSWEDGTLGTIRSVAARLHSVDLVVCESFTPRPGVRTWQPASLESIGALRYICWRLGTEFKLQTPAEAKRFSTNAKLASIGWRHPTKGGHADDAARHLLLAAVRRGLIDVASL